MKAVNPIACIVALLLVAGCATTFRPWRLSEIDEGMDRARVVQILGEPDRTEMKDGSEFLYYSYTEDYTSPLGSDSAAAYDADLELRKQQIKNSLKVYRYSVKIVDGKVQSYAEIQE